MSNDKTLELQIRIAAEDAARIVSALKGDIKGLADEANKFSKNNELEKSFKEAETAAKGTVTSIGDIKRALGSLAEVAVAAKALSLIKDMGKFALQTADNFQTMKNQFGILLGDMEAGKSLFNEIKAFGDITPFDLDTLTQATNVLIAAKVPLADLQSQLTKFGDLSQGNSQRLTSYIHAFSMAAAKGKADMQVLNTYLNQGVPILDTLAKNFGKTTAEIIDMSSNGQISFEDFSSALDELTAAGGRYFGGMELASKSLAAMQEGLSEAVNTLAASYGDMLLPAANAALGTLTKLTNVINEDPILKGLFAAAIASASVYLAAMAVKAGIAFAAQMKLNLAIGVLNPAVLAATGAVAILAVTYVGTAAAIDKMAKGTDSHTASLRWQRNAIDDSRAAIENYRLSLQGLNLDEVIRKIGEAEREVAQRTAESLRDLSSRNNLAGSGIIVFDDSIEAQKLQEAIKRFNELRTEFINEFSKEDNKVIELRNRIELAQTYIVTVDISREDQTALEAIIKDARDEIDYILGESQRKAAEWKNTWSEVYGQFNADESGDMFYRIELERNKRLADARKNYLQNDRDVINQINDYYNAQRSDVIRQLAEEEARIQRELTQTKVDDIEYELQEALRAIDTLETRRIIAAGDSEEEIAAIRKRFDELREGTNTQFKVRIDTAIFEESATEMSKWIDEMFGNTQAAHIERINEQLAKANEYLSGADSDVDKNRLIAIIKGLNEEIGRLNGNETAESWIEKMFGNTQAARIEKINEHLAKANQYLSDEGLNDIQKNRLAAVIEGLNEELDRFTEKASDSERAAAEWKKSWEEAWNQFQADQAGDLFYSIEQEQNKRLADAEKYFEDNRELIDQINEYYDEQRSKIIDKLAKEEARVLKDMAEKEERILRDLTKSKIDNLEYELQRALDAINEIEEYRITAAGEAEEEIAAIRERFAQMRTDTESEFRIRIDMAELEEARESVKNWQEELSDSLLRLIMDLEIFADQTAVILSELSSQLIQLSVSAAMTGFEEFGRSLGAAEDGANHFLDALAKMAQQILKQLPMMFLQAGLQLLAQSNPLGWGFIAAAGSSAILSGYVDGVNSRASKHAQGGVFDEYGKAARAFAAGGVFTNQVVTAPTYFAHGGGFGLMGEAGPEAIMPLTRMANGNLGVQTAGANVYVNIKNYSGENVKQEETQDANGNTNLEISIGNAINKHLTSGKADRPMASRFGVRPVGV